MSSPSPTADRPLRRDAERNRRRILDAAGVVFAERGLRASYDDIAREAGVGVGTVYRRFPDKELLVDALFEERMSTMVALAEESLAMEDPWDGLVHFIVRGQEFQGADRGLKELILTSDAGLARVAGARSRIAPMAEKILDRARTAGAVRADLALSDIPLIQVALGAIVDATRDVAPETWRRLLAIVLDGLRPDGRAPHEMANPPLDMQQLETAMHAVGAARRR